MKAAASSPVVAEVTWPQVHAFRLRRHHLATTERGAGLVTTVRDIGGAQAQVMSAAELQIAVRTGGGTAAVRQALWERRTLVKTWLMRGTLHLVPAEDLPLYTAAMQGRWSKVRSSWLSYVGMSEPQLIRLCDDIGAAMNGTPMTREEVLERVGPNQPAQVREMLRSGWGSLLKPVARRGLLCFGPSRGQSVTFLNPRHWLGGWSDLDPETAIAEIARRYLRAFGPATKADFARWWGNWPGVGQAAWAGLAGELASVSIEGLRADVLRSDVDSLGDPPLERSVVLLPPFDPYLMGHSSRGHLFEPQHAAKVSRKAGWISAVVLVDGRVEGTWTGTRIGKTLRFDVVPFKRLAGWVTRAIGERATEIAQAAGVESAGVDLGPADDAFGAKRAE